ncbi:MAG: NADH-quinone oxidoreductase subunit J [Caldilineaceae bacterium]|nr:NADH-quinone oxidoreductase subunit J [Caldilineaceae bacterium]
MTLSLLFFLVVGAVCLAAAVGVVLSREPVHSALFLLTNFATLAVLYVTLEAQFLAAAQVIVYAGGIVILILFVIMLIGGSTNDFSAQQRTWSRYAGVILGVIMLGSLGVTILQRVENVSPQAVAAVQGGVPPVIGITLFTEYVLPFELVGILLLVALLGALVLGRQPEEEASTQSSKELQSS